MKNNYEKSAFVSVNRFNSKAIIAKIGLLLFTFMVLTSASVQATNVNVGTISSNTSWSGTTSSNTCSTRPSYDNQYQFVAGVSGTFTFSTCGGASWDTYMYLSTGSCNSGGITSNDDYCGLQTTVSATLTAGNTYYLLIEGYSTSSYGSYTITVSVPVAGQMIVPSTGNNTYTVCSGVLYDAGGSTGNYADNWNGYTVLYPSTSGAMLQISGTTSGESCCDYISIYDGTSTSATLLGSYVANYGTIPTLTATNSQGALTVRFTSDGSVTGSGFSLNLNCSVPNPATPATPTSNSPYCSNVTISRTGSAPSGEVWYWQTSATGTSTTYSGSTYTVSSSGTYYIRSRRTSDGVWSSAASISVVVDQMPTAVNAGPDAQICQSSSTQLSGSANGTSVSYSWSPSTGLSNANIYNPTASPSSTTTYTMTASSGTCQATDQITITVNPQVTVAVSISSGELNNTICAGNEMSFTATPTNGENEEYQWKLNGNDVGTNSNTYTATNLVSGDQIYVVMSSDINCAVSNQASSNTITITVQTPDIPYLSDGDYIWTGASSSDWTNSANWIVFDGTTYGQAISAPANDDNVFFKSFYSCVNNDANTPALSEITCNDICIETGLSLGNISILNVRGDWKNSGSFVAGNGVVKFVGNAKQTILPGPSEFNNIVFSNTSNGNDNIEIQQPMIINGNAEFTDGIINFAGTGSLTFGDNASVTVSSNNSFVNGSIVKTGTSQFIFPTGDVNSRDFDGNGMIEYAVLGAIMVTPSEDATVSAEYFFSNENGMPDWWEHSGNMDESIHHVSDREHWVVNSDVNLNNIALHWYDNGHNNGEICIHGFDNGNSADFVEEDLTVAFWSGTLWRNAGGIFSGNHDAGSITSELAIPFGFKAPTYVTFGSKNNLNPLPVELTSFAAICNDGNVVINWETAAEINNSHFLVQVSEDMQSFTTIETVYGAGNSSVANNYTIEYMSNISEAYYRLIQVDYDGTQKIYPPVFASCSETQKSANLSVYPNPFNTDITIAIENFSSNNALIQIIDNLGKIVFETTIAIDGLFTEQVVYPQNLKSGVYTMRLTGNDSVITKQIVKQ